MGRPVSLTLPWGTCLEMDKHVAGKIAKHQSCQPFVTAGHVSHYSDFIFVERPKQCSDCEVEHCLRRSLSNWKSIMTSMRSLEV